MVGKRNLGGMAFMVVIAFLLVETCLTMRMRFGEVDFSAAFLAVGFMATPIALAAIFALLASTRSVVIAAWLLASVSLLVAAWLLYEVWSSRSSTAIIALVFWPIVEVGAIIGCLGLIQLIASATNKVSSRNTR